MQQFLNIISSFPTIIYSILLGVVVIYWLGASLGLLDIDVLDGNLHDPSGGVHHIDITDASNLTGLAGILLTLGLNGVPITIIITFLVLYGWIVCYFLMLLVSPLMGTGGWMVTLLGIPVFFGTFAVSIFLSAQTIKPLRRLSEKTQAKNKTTQSLIGKTGIVRTSKITASFGEVTVEDGGAGLLLKVRAEEPNTFKRGDHVVLMEFMEAEHTYKIMSEQDLYQSTVE